MRIIKITLVLQCLLVSAFIFGQQENALLDRSFWKASPNLEQVKLKIKEGHSPTELNRNAFDAVIYALLENIDAAVVKYLLSLKGNEVDKKTHDSRIYLHWAAYCGQLEIVKHLLELGSSMSVLDSHGYTPLTFAANAGIKDKRLYELFEKNGLDLRGEKNENGANLLLLVAHSLTNDDELKYFMDKDFSLNSKDAQNNGIFNYASKKGNKDFLNLLIKKGVDYQSLNSEGGNAFLFAAQGSRGHTNSLAFYNYLQGLGIEPNVVSKEGYTPLHRLSYTNKNPAIHKYFLREGASVSQKDAQGSTPFLNAASWNELAIVELLSSKVENYDISNNKGQTALMLATYRNNEEVVSYLLEKGSDPLAIDKDGNSLAYYLIQSFESRNPAGFERKLKMFQAKGLKMSALQSGNNTLIHIAAQNNNLALLKKLLNFNIDLNKKNAEGLTALHIAAMKAEDDRMMKFLISEGADQNITTDFEETVYDLASENELLQNRSTSLKFLNND